MTKLDYVRRQTTHLLDRVLKVFDKAFLLIPPEQLDFRPTPVSMSARELGAHAYQAIYVLVRAAATGACRRADLADMPLDLAQIERAEDLVAYGRKVKDYVRGALANLTEDDLERMTVNDLGPSAPGYVSMSMAYEEALHHRGQLMLYLRMMGIEPMRPYDYR